jgi:hypothetical protein
MVRHISQELTLRTFLRLEIERVRHGVSWYESKISLVRGAISCYLANPALTLASA